VAHAENALGVIDAKTYALKADIKLPAAAEGFQMETKRPRIYLNTPSPSQVVVIDTEKNEVVKTYPRRRVSRWRRRSRYSTDTLRPSPAANITVHGDAVAVIRLTLYGRVRQQI
jgi:hypothetical protein